MEVRLTELKWNVLEVDTHCNTHCNMMAQHILQHGVVAVCRLK